MANAEQALPPGYRIGPYEVMQLLGAGTFGNVYLCRHHEDGDLVAVREYMPFDTATRTDDMAVRASLAAAEATFQDGLAVFRDRARRMASVDHPNLVRVREQLEVNGTAYVVMDYAQGRRLSQLVPEAAALEEEQLAGYLRPIAEGLMAMHEAGVVHGSLGLDSIVVTDEGVPQLLGLAVPARDAFGAVAKPGFAPIEQYSASDDLASPKNRRLFARGCAVSVRDRADAARGTDTSGAGYARSGGADTRSQQIFRWTLGHDRRGADFGPGRKAGTDRRVAGRVAVGDAISARRAGCTGGAATGRNTCARAGGAGPANICARPRCAGPGAGLAEPRQRRNRRARCCWVGWLQASSSRPSVLSRFWVGATVTGLTCSATQTKERPRKKWLRSRPSPRHRCQKRCLATTWQHRRSRLKRRRCLQKKVTVDEEAEAAGMSSLSVADDAAGVRPCTLTDWRWGRRRSNWTTLLPGPGNCRCSIHSTKRWSLRWLLEAGASERIERELILATGGLELAVSPASAWVELDGERLAEGMPATLAALPAGTVTLTVGAPGHEVVEVEAVVPAGGVESLDLTLEPAFGTLTLALVPADAEVEFLDIGGILHTGHVARRGGASTDRVSARVRAGDPHRGGSWRHRVRGDARTLAASVHSRRQSPGCSGSLRRQRHGLHRRHGTHARGVRP